MVVAPRGIMYFQVVNSNVLKACLCTVDLYWLWKEYSFVFKLGADANSNMANMEANFPESSSTEKQTTIYLK